MERSSRRPVDTSKTGSGHPRVECESGGDPATGLEADGCAVPRGGGAGSPYRHRWARRAASGGRVKPVKELGILTS